MLRRTVPENDGGLCAVPIDLLGRKFVRPDVENLPVFCFDTSWLSSGGIGRTECRQAPMLELAKSAPLYQLS